MKNNIRPVQGQKLDAEEEPPRKNETNQEDAKAVDDVRNVIKGDMTHDQKKRATTITIKKTIGVKADELHQKNNISSQLNNM
ncbi:hypothetical protein RIR_jg6689.t1 [Rhizophagus irregularis DAOM 181602=DAOM 197198]|uniref:Uncharacterized protein n=1 Tax=Rhizophagus irregularis (strain DAOM 181602 / DAOM 197198 / MUCL 43194) TaxID=747089 RepID=U9UAC6_RHIID|nr:hypothetical protein RIR_jg6689.t1 [Rhizophagus irregularis DAOM 181602=DAOM 197198]